MRRFLVLSAFALWACGEPGLDENGAALEDQDGDEAPELASATSALTEVWSGDYADAYGWVRSEHYRTVRFVDVTGDGRVDVCARGARGIWCAVANDRGFDRATVWSEYFGNPNGWSDPKYYETIEFPDLNGDKKADICGRHTSGIVCALSDGTSFYAISDRGHWSPVHFWTYKFNDNDGWGKPQYYETIRYPDLNKDGRADLCGRGGDGIWCAVSNGATFTNLRRWIYAFDDANRWNEPASYRTIAFPDVNGDKRADVCGRGHNGVWCAVANEQGDAFVSLNRWQTDFDDSRGWAEGPWFYETLRFPDVTGDGKADICGRGGRGIYCALSNGSAFTDMRLWTSTFADNQGGYNGREPGTYESMLYHDITGDGRADVCALTTHGLTCLRNQNGREFSAPGSFGSGTAEWLGMSGAPYRQSLAFVSQYQVCGRGPQGIVCGRDTHRWGCHTNKVVTAYQSYLARDPDDRELDAWCTVNGRVPGEDDFSWYLKQPEANFDRSHIIDTVYREYYQRAPLAHERDYWRDEIERKGHTYRDLARFLRSTSDPENDPPPTPRPTTCPGSYVECGRGCDGHNYPARYTSSSQCLGTGNNATVCFPVCGDVIERCEIDQCPAGYRKSQNVYRAHCSTSSQTGHAANATICVKN